MVYFIVLALEYEEDRTLLSLLLFQRKTAKGCSYTLIYTTAISLDQNRTHMHTFQLTTYKYVIGLEIMIYFSP